MDWSRTKTILIIALLLTNSVLFFVLYGDRIGARTDYENNQNQLTEVLKLLESEQVTVTTDVPTQDLVMTDIRLTYETYEDETMIQILLGENFTNIDGQYLSKDAGVRILETQELVYQLLNPLGGYVETDVDQATEIAKNFLDSVGLQYSSVAHWVTEQQDDGTVLVEFRQIEDGYFVENAYMKLIVSNTSVIELRRKWFGAIEVQDTSKIVESPAKALFRVLSEIDGNTDIQRPVEIESMDLGYRLISNILTINFQEGEPMPYWRFRTAQGDVIYIEAQTE